MRLGRTIVAVVATALLLSTGCVGTGTFRKSNEQNSARAASVETAVEANERRIADLKSETDRKIATVEGEVDRAVDVGEEAQKRAQAAEQAAKGKLLWSVTLSDDSVKFSFDEATVPEEAAGSLESLIQKIRQYDKTVFVEIAGHTDNIGGEQYNHDLGYRRAMAVRDHLGKKGGIPLHAMNVISYGESQPLADNSTPEGRAQNRRVVIKVLE